MHTQISMRAIVFGGVAIAAGIGVLAAQPLVSAQAEEDGGVVVGTYSPDLLTREAGLEERMNAEMSPLQERMMQAQQQGDQQAMQQIQAEAQRIQEDIIGEFERQVDSVLPEVADDTGVQLIAAEVAWTAPEVQTTDVTHDIAQLMDDTVTEAPRTPEVPLEPQTPQSPQAPPAPAPGAPGQ